MQKSARFRDPRGPFAVPRSAAIEGDARGCGGTNPPSKSLHRLRLSAIWIADLRLLDRAAENPG